jgi:ComEC/Rec2-related protein
MGFLLLLAEKFNLLKRKCGSVLEKYPALLILAGLLNGILPIALEIPLWFLTLVFLLTLSLPVILALKNKRVLLIFWLATVIGVLTCYLNLRTSQDNYIHELPAGDCGALIEVKITDSSCTGKTLSWLPNPRYIRAEIQRLKFTESDQWQEVSGVLMLKASENLIRPVYGDKLTVQGIFQQPKSPAFDGAFDFRKFLFIRGVKKLFQVREVLERDRSDWNFYRGILEFRNKLLSVVSESVKSEDNKRLLAALLFGCRQGLDLSQKNNFIQSGTIHIFTVSGLHVGIFALILIWLLRWIPFRQRYVILPSLIFLYVLTTGCNPPAVRALLMISLWCFCRAFLYSTSSLNIVFLAASLILVFRPFYILDCGFQYSFVIVAILIRSGTSIREWSSCIYQHFDWIPPDARKVSEIMRYRVSGWLLNIFLFCLIAWLASAGITVYNQNLFLPYSVIANIILSPVVALIFIFTVLKIGLAICFVPSFIMAFPLEQSMNFMVKVSETLSGSSELLARPPLWSIFLFYILLVVLVSTSKRRIFIATLAGIAGIIFFWNVRSEFLADRILLIHGGESQEPCVVLSSPARRNSLIINAPSWSSAFTVADFLRIDGIKRINFLVAGGVKKAFLDGLGPLTSKCRTEVFLYSMTSRQTPWFKRQLLEAVRNGVKAKEIYPDLNNQQYWRFSNSDLEVMQEKSLMVISFPFGVELEIAPDELGCRSVRISREGIEYRILLENSLEPSCRIIELENKKP